MVSHYPTFNETARIYPQVGRNTDNDEHSSGRPWQKISRKRMDMTTKLSEFDLNDLNIHEITERGQLIAALEELGLPEEHGVYYICIRNTIKQSKTTPKEFKRKGKTMKRNGRPPYSRPALEALGIRNRPRQRTFEGMNCILKFEAADGKILQVIENKGKRKRKPYNAPKYELLRKLELNKKRKKTDEF